MTTMNPVIPLGFPVAAFPNHSESVARPTPLPKRPKGNWFIGVILVALCGIITYTVWGSFFRYQAYGTVSGHLITDFP